MSETIVVEAVSDKFKNKYNSGSVLAGGKWLQVASKLDLSLFQKDSQVTVETKTNDKGYTSIVGVLDAGQPADVSVKTKEPVKRATKPKEASTASYEDTKSRRILVQGIVQATIQSPATINFGSEPEEVFQKTRELALMLVDLVEAETK